MSLIPLVQISRATSVTQDHVSDEEELYRNVRGNLEYEEYSHDSTGRLTFLPKAFQDKEKEPSVDRAKLRNFDPEQSRMSEENGIVTLITEEVRQIGDVKTNNDRGKPVKHVVDISPDPIRGNKAHALIVVDPDFFGTESKKNKAFKLLRKALARLATQRGWTLEPRSP